MKCGILFQKRFNENPLKRLGYYKSQRALHEIHNEKWGEHQGQIKLYR